MITITPEIVKKLAEIHEWALNTEIFANEEVLDVFLSVDSRGRASVQIEVRDEESVDYNVIMFMFLKHEERDIEYFLNTCPEMLYYTTASYNFFDWMY